MKRLFTLLTFTFLYQCSSAQWVNHASIPAVRCSHATFAIGDTGYAVSGGGSLGYVTSAYKYTAGAWTQIANYPSGQDNGVIGFAIGDTGYVGTGAAGGYSYSASFYKYDTRNNNWTQINNYPGPGRCADVSFVINGKGYIGGGLNSLIGNYGNNNPLNDFYVYDPSTGQWDSIARCPAKGIGVNAVAFAVNGKGYVGTGGNFPPGSQTWVPQQDFWQYDPTTNTWDSIAPYPGGPRMGAFGFATCSKGYVGGGVSDVNQSQFQSDFYEYDPSNGPLGTWKPLQNYGGGGRSWARAFVLDNHGYVVGGNDPNTTNGELWEYVPAASSNTPGFSAVTTACVGIPVTFTDTSNYSPNSWQWTFPGATPNSSSQQNPIIQFDSAGTYDVILTASNGCNSGTQTFTNYITVSNPVALVVTASPAFVCSGATSSLTITNASGNNYTWSPAISLKDSTGSTVQATPLVTTTYSVTGNSSSCVPTGQVVVAVGNTANAGIISTLRDTICAGTPGKLLITGNSKDSLFWQSSLNGTDFSNVPNQTPADTDQYRTLPLLTSTYFRVVVSSGNCSSISDTLQLVVPPSLTASFSYTLIGNTATFNSNNSQGNIRSYFWDFGDGTTSSTANPTHTYTADTAVSACLTIYDGSNCSYTFCRAIVWSGVKEISDAGNWNIYPSPFADELTIESKQANTVVENAEMYNVLGQLVISETNTHSANSVFRFNVSSLAKGMYFLQVNTTTSSFVQKVVKQQS